MVHKLTIPEQFFVIVQNKKITRMKWMLSGYRQLYVIAGCFIELSKQKRITFGEKLEVQVVDETPTGIDYLDEMLMQIAKIKKERKLLSWMREFSLKLWKQKKIYDLLARSLLEKGVIQKEKSLLFNRYVGLDPHERQIVEMIRAEVLEPGKVSHDALILTFMLHTAKVLKELFSHYEGGEWKKRIKELQEEYPREWKQVETISKVIQEIAASAASSAAT
ncbi:GPP34 family phosphoprotein [Paenactinomyces guangxiensis]|uniref:GPP34 family phosphoprotein n=1 Tax=Paenactinomyces guangxiensis TaxID=1490290 RepID=A0A7W1WSL7_9BACL|nr:GPP34 family phosphoprotein [Paenactinomyces guangxiensis]MBA4495300.1 GPP34 family phosphoprotein [Paenactinomyces guangxiensis]MBH8592578.1 GPP34 family phosphoprotein [Paenactinomyces guangxiensis]